MNSMDDGEVIPFESPSRADVAASLGDDKKIKYSNQTRIKMLGMQRGDKYSDIDYNSWDPDEYGLPPDCPVVPLGRKGNVCFVLTASGTVMELTVGTQKKSAFVLAFGRFVPYLNWAWPRWDKKSKEFDPYNFDAEMCYTDYINACSKKMDQFGPWEPEKMLRGRGCWQHNDGLIIHLGDRLLLPDGKFVPAGSHGGYLYAKKSRIIPPSEKSPVGDYYGPGAALFTHLQSWNWVRPEIDPFLLLGWIGQAFVSGALEWRSVVWMIGGAGTGKSTALHLCERILGGLAHRSDNSTAPAIYRGLSGDAGAVILDESEEAGTDDRKAKALVDLSTQAASGALVQRAGGPDGGTQTFPVVSSFLFAAITPPAMNSAAYSRMAKLELRALEPGTTLGDWDNEQFVSEIGAKIFSRMICDFPRLQRCINMYKQELIRIGHSARGGDAFGSLLGCAHVVIDDDEPLEGEVLSWCDLLNPSTLAELELASSNWSDCWDALLSAQPKSFSHHTKNKSVGALINEYRVQGMTNGDDALPSPGALKLFRSRLNSVGLSLILPHNDLSYDNAYLFVPSLSDGLKNLTIGTSYHGRGKVITALKQMPESWIKIGANARIDGMQKKGIGVHLNSIMPQEGKE